MLSVDWGMARSVAAGFLLAGLLLLIVNKVL